MGGVADKVRTVSGVVAAVGVAIGMVSVSALRHKHNRASTWPSLHHSSIQSIGRTDATLRCPNGHQKSKSSARHEDELMLWRNWESNPEPSPLNRY
jgi:hypothetical protein